MIRTTRTINHPSAALEPFAPLPADILARRRVVLRETAGCWSDEEARRIVAELHALFDAPDDSNGAETP